MHVGSDGREVPAEVRQPVVPSARPARVNHLWAWIVELTGTKSSQSQAYNFWSGFGGDLALIVSFLAAPVLLYRKHNCGVRWCWRIARHDFHDPESGIMHHLCRRHHPEHPGKPIRAAELRHRYHLYAGKRPGKG